MVNAMDYLLRDKSKGSKLIQGSTMTEDVVLMGKARVIDSQLRDLAVVMDTAHIDRSTVAYQGKVFGNSFALESYIGGNATVSGNANLLRTALFNTAVVTDKGTVINSILSDRVLIMENAVVYNSLISGNVVIAGNALIKDVEMCGDLYINEGQWVGETPCYCQPIAGLPFGITESVHDRWTIGCSTFPFKFWMEKAHFICRKMGLNSQQAEDYKKLLTWFRQSVRTYKLQQKRDKEDAEN